MGTDHESSNTVLSFAGLHIRYRAQSQSHQRETVRVALGEELRLISLELTEMLDNIQGAAEGVIINVGHKPEVYASQVGNIGLLSVTQTRAVIRAYFSVRSATANIMRDSERQGEYYLLHRTSFAMAKGQLSDARASVDAAIKLLGT